MEKASSARVHMWSAGKHDESSFLLHLHCALFGSCTVARGQEMYLNLYIYTPPTFCNRGVHDTVLNILSMYEYWISLLVLFIFIIVLWYLGTLLVLLYFLSNIYFRSQSRMAISRSYPRHLVQFHEKERKKHFTSFFLSFKKMQLWIKMHLFFCIFLLHLLKRRNFRKLRSRPVICPVICPVIRPVICPVIHPVIRPSLEANERIF